MKKKEREIGVKKQNEYTQKREENHDKDEKELKEKLIQS